jgi:hypothetical protein
MSLLLFTALVAISISSIPVSALGGDISISTTPSGARIYLDNQNKGVTPVIIKDVLPGLHTIKLTFTDYDDWTTIIDVVEGSTTTISVPMNKTAIYFTSIPSGAYIFLDNYQIGYTPFTKTKLLPGSHNIKLTLNKYDDWIKTVNVVEGSTTTVYAELSIKGSTQNPAPTYTTSNITSTPMDSLGFTIIDIQKSSETSPEINIEPIDEQERSNTTVFLSGYASSDSGIKSVTVNGQYAGTENWIAPIDFSGDGNIVIIATGNDGNTTKQNISTKSPSSESGFIEIISALIGALATIIAAYFGYRAIKKK